MLMKTPKSLFSPRFTDVEKGTWLIRNPENQSEWVEIPAWSIPVKDGMVEWPN